MIGRASVRLSFCDSFSIKVLVNDAHRALLKFYPHLFQLTLKLFYLSLSSATPPSLLFLPCCHMVFVTSLKLHPRVALVQLTLPTNLPTPDSIEKTARADTRLIRHALYSSSTAYDPIGKRLVPYISSRCSAGQWKL
jgi:hypothetical protein